MILNFRDYKTTKKIHLKNNKLIFSNDSDYSASVVDTCGRYEFLNNILLVVFSYEGKNFLYLNSELIELTPNINIEYSIAQDRKIKSWLKIFDNVKLVFEIEYINPNEPFILPDPFGYDEDFNTTNFGCHLAGYINKIRENPNVILFPVE
jgi:hypothetical protein